MTQREKYQLEFSWITGPVSRQVRPRAQALTDANRFPSGGAKSFLLTTILNARDRSSDIDRMLQDVNSAISNPSSLDDSYSLDDGTYVAMFGGNLVFGDKESPTDAANYTIPLADYTIWNYCSSGKAL